MGIYFLTMQFLEPWKYLIIAVGAFCAGIVNALAGGGTLITFPLLTFLGVPAVAANMTNTIALCPGYFGATIAQLKELVAQKRRVWVYLPLAILGGVYGGYLLLRSGEKVFRGLVPYLILLATALLAFGGLIKKRQQKVAAGNTSASWRVYIGIPFIAAAAIYGGYFGAGLGLILLAVLGTLFKDSLVHLNALKQVLSMATNVAAAIYFLFSGQINWWMVLVMAIFALLGGLAGGKLVGKIHPEVLRWLVVGIGLIVSIYYFLH